MRISLNWVARLLGEERLAVSDEDLLDTLIDHLAEIEGIESSLPELDGVIVGHVRTCAQHPDADRLRVCSVDVGGDEPLPIVCGAPNVAAGQKVAVATIGTVLEMTDKNGEVQSLKIKKGKLRGVASHGMICAEDELGLSDNHDGILVLDGDASIGAPLREALSNADRILDIDNHNINHRPDLWGHIGWARELAILFDKQQPPAIDISMPTHGDTWSVAIQDEHCTTYCGAVVEGVDNRPSPAWMQALLQAAGVRPLGLLVDVTNYVMLELGEPMHAFDRRQIAGTEIIVRSAAAGEIFTTLDGQEHELQAGDLLIADTQKSLALAGIMGGEGSMVRDDTSCIVLEAAIFDPGCIRQTRIRTGLSTESSNRFEKGLFPAMAPAAINRAIELIQKIIPEAQVSERFVSGDCSAEERLLDYDCALARRIIGIELSDANQQRSLKQLGFEQRGDQWLVPWWRHKDIEASIDLVEEVGRLHGYAQLPAEVPRLPAAVPQQNHLRQTEHRCRRILSGLGWDEVATYAFTSDAWAETLQWSADQAIRLDHPLSSEQTVMRLSMLPTLFEALLRNRRHFDHVAIYEIGKMYGQNIFHAPCSDERLCLAGAFLEQGNDEPFYAARDAACAVLGRLGYDVSLQVSSDKRPGFDSQRQVDFIIDGRAFGYAAEIDTDLRKQHKCRERAAFFHVDIEVLLEAIEHVKPVVMQAPSRYQQVEREFTWVCPEQLLWDELSNCVAGAAGKLCRAIDLMTVYRGDQIDAGKKAISMRVTLQADDRTLSDKELQKCSNKIIKTVEHQTSAALRG